MTIVYGAGIEPGGMELDSQSDLDDCPKCPGQAHYRHWEQAEGGSINQYSYISCSCCGYFEGDDPHELN